MVRFKGTLIELVELPPIRPCVYTNVCEPVSGSYAACTRLPGGGEGGGVWGAKFHEHGL